MFKVPKQAISIEESMVMENAYRNGSWTLRGSRSNNLRSTFSLFNFHRYLPAYFGLCTKMQPTLLLHTRQIDSVLLVPIMGNISSLYRTILQVETTQISY